MSACNADPEPTNPRPPPQVPCAPAYELCDGIACALNQFCARGRCVLNTCQERRTAACPGDSSSLLPVACDSPSVTECAKSAHFSCSIGPRNTTVSCSLPATTNSAMRVRPVPCTHCCSPSWPCSAALSPTTLQLSACHATRFVCAGGQTLSGPGVIVSGSACAAAAVAAWLTRNASRHPFCMIWHCLPATADPDCLLRQTRQWPPLQQTSLDTVKHCIVAFLVFIIC